jgi:hypothetical protein
MHNNILCCFFFFFVYLFSYSFCIHYHLLSFSVYSHAAITFLLRKMTSFSLSLTHTFTFARRESLSTTYDVVVNVFFFCIVVVLSLPHSLSLCRFLPVPFVQEKEVQRVDKLFVTTHFFLFFLHIINFPFL